MTVKVSSLAFWSMKSDRKETLGADRLQNNLHPEWIVEGMRANYLSHTHTLTPQSAVLSDGCHYV